MHGREEGLGDEALEVGGGQGPGGEVAAVRAQRYDPQLPLLVYLRVISVMGAVREGA